MERTISSGLVSLPRIFDINADRSSGVSLSTRGIYHAEPAEETGEFCLTQSQQGWQGGVKVLPQVPLLSLREMKQ